jgi:hypothetical protein
MTTTMTTSLHRPGRRPRETAPSTGRSTLVIAVLLAVSASVIVLAGWAAMSLTPGKGSSGATEIAVKGGVVQFEGVTPEVLAHAPGMPGQMMPQPVPAGFRRISVEISLLATGTGMTYDAGNFRMSAPGVKPVPPQRDALGSGVVPEGSRVNGELVFVVPESARTLSLHLRGADGSIPVDAGPAPEHSGGHAG